MAALRSCRGGLPTASGFRPPLGNETQAGNAVSESGSIVAETAARIFADLADPQEINRAPKTTPGKARCGRRSPTPG